MDAGEPIVFRFRRQSRRTWIGLVVLPTGLVWWVVDTRSVVSFVLGALGLLLFAWGWITMLRVHGRGSSRQLVVSREGLSTSMWKIAWAGVDDVSVEQRPFIGDTLVVEPVHREDIESAPVRGVFALTARINDLSSFPKLAIPQKLLEQSVAEVLRAMEERSGRTFGRATLDPKTEEEP